MNIKEDNKKKKRGKHPQQQKEVKKMDDSGEKPNFIGFYKHRLRGFFLKMRSLIEDNRIWEKGCPYPPKLIQPYPKKRKTMGIKSLSRIWFTICL